MVSFEAIPGPPAAPLVPISPLHQGLRLAQRPDNLVCLFAKSQPELESEVASVSSVASRFHLPGQFVIRGRRTRAARGLPMSPVPTDPHGPLQL